MEGSDRRVAQGLAMAVAAYFAWGLLSPVGKILLETFPPMSLNAVRMVIATVLLLLFVPRALFHEGLQYLRRPRIAALVLLGGGIDFTFFLYALTFVDATFATLGFYTAPLWTAILARLRLGERLGLSFLPAIIALLAGGYLSLFGLGAVPVEGFHAGGMALAVLSGLGWAVYAVGLRVAAPGLRLRPLLVASFVISTFYFILLAWLVEGPPPLAGQTVSAWAWMFVHAAVPTTAALLLFNASLQRAPASLVNMLVGVELAATVLFSWWLLGDRFSAVQMAGLGLTLVAVSGYVWARGRASRRGRAKVEQRVPGA